ncbi:MAG: helix-turn-helix domain-containing protein [Planctomycetes bacterium]|nr:helix-turn-helix domain-containing protein [Planctomycetota bacterium]
MQDYLTVADVAVLLQLSEKTVYRLAQRGDLPGFKVGGSWRFRRRDIDLWARTQVKRRRGA